MAEPKKKKVLYLRCPGNNSEEKLPFLHSSFTLIHLGPGGFVDGFCTEDDGNAGKLIPGWNGGPGWVGMTTGC